MRGHRESAPGFEPTAAAGLPARRLIPSRVSGQRCARLTGKELRAGPEGGGGGGESKVQSAGGRQAEAERWSRAAGEEHAFIRPVTPACRRLVACNQDRRAENWSSICRPSCTALGPFLSVAGASALHRK